MSPVVFLFFNHILMFVGGNFFFCIGAYWQYLKEPYGIMAIIAGSLAGSMLLQ
jgi:ABC-type phosphate transport system permease subunit